MARDAAKGEPRKRLSFMRYRDGPMGYLADQIMKEMQRAGYPPKEFNLYRSPSQQDAYKAGGTSNASAFSSAHQFFCASDIIHEKYAWFAKPKNGPKPPDGKHFWNCLWDCVEVVAERHDVQFKPRLSWDAAHVELAEWHSFRSWCGPNLHPDDTELYTKPTQEQLDQWFAIVLPKVWKAHLLAEKVKNS